MAAALSLRFLVVIVRAEAAESPSAPPFIIQGAAGDYSISIDTASAPELKQWAESKLAPVLAEWYPKIVALLPSDGFVAPKGFSVVLKPGDGVAATAGTRITANSAWLQGELDREGIGALIHEVVHVVQQYGRGPRGGSNRAPGWLVEGIADYIRWFKFEPQSHGADIPWLRSRRNPALRHDAGYRITANFLNYVVEHHDPDKKLIAKLNAAGREGKYTDALWLEFTGKPLPELNSEWKEWVRRQLASQPGVQ